MTSITPQLIKDQEFEVKFRGFDPIEVRDYLETLADEFFELQEQVKEQIDELEALRETNETSDTYKASLETDMEFTRKVSEELKDGCTQKEEKIKDLTAELEELQLRIADMEQENSEHDEELSADQARIGEAEKALKISETEKERLQSKVEILQEQNEDLKKEEVDFKSTLAAAQRFAEDLKEKSREEADGMIAEANGTIEKIRDDAQAELERLPREIEELKKIKGEVKGDLKTTLASYLETIEVFYPEEDADERTGSGAADGDELFQKIELNADGSMSTEDAKKRDRNGPDNAHSEQVDETVLGDLLSGEGR